MKKSRRRANVDLHLIQPKFPSSVATSVRNFFDHHGKDLAVAVKVEGTRDFSLFDGIEKFPNRSPEDFLCSIFYSNRFSSAISEREGISCK